MLYIEMQLSGTVKVYELSDKLVLLKAYVLANGECVNPPETIDDAIEYMKADCYRLEIFECFEDAEDWADTYTSFRAEEVRAELRRFATRRDALTGQACAVA
ncbi:hypothetical protein [Novosphingobium sp. FKTRR1]|uniref:hypothetical protein n=1 Tax=Novosphingobium sp. FKTRR1 TaxID=2879118 RepID=UPI001CF0C27C|nr:hypothetical protein [Novosphingobium sp. FKTRR1]